MKIKVIVFIILMQLLLIQNYCFSDEVDEGIEAEENYSVLLSLNILGPFIGLYSGDVELRLHTNGSLKIGLSYMNPAFNMLKDIISIELEATLSDGTIITYTEDFYVIGTLLQYNLLLNNYFPNSLYLGFGTSYVLINIDDNTNTQLSGLYNNITPFILLGLQAVNNSILYRIELGVQYSFPTVEIDNFFTANMFDVSKAKGFGIYFNISKFE